MVSQGKKKTQRGTQLNEKTNRQARGRIRSRIGSFHGYDSCVGNPSTREERWPPDAGEDEIEGWIPPVVANASIEFF